LLFTALALQEVIQAIIIIVSIVFLKVKADFLLQGNFITWRVLLKRRTFRAILSAKSDTLENGV
jgi:hypothetical protein